MASIFTGLAFMHGHIVDRELVLRLGCEKPAKGKGTRHKVLCPTPVEKTREHGTVPACALGC